MSPLTPADRAMALARPGVVPDDLDRYETLLAQRVHNREIANLEEARELRALAAKLGFGRSAPSTADAASA